MPRGSLHSRSPPLWRPARTCLSVSRPRHSRHQLRTHLSAPQKMNLSTVFAGQALGIKEVEEGIWLVSFMEYDLGYIDLEEKTLQPLNNPFGPKVSPVRSVTYVFGPDPLESGAGDGNRTHVRSLG